MPGPFAGLKIVDLTTVFVGPYCTQLLADMGADVIKVEAPDGDLTRLTSPARNPGMTSSFLQLNRNKRSVVLDLKTKDGAAAMRKLIQGADAFVHNMRPEPLARLGFDYESVKHLNPNLVYCNIWGFGTGGRYAGRAAFDDIIQAASGLVALEGYGGKPPRFVPMLIADKATGLFAAFAMAAALYHKLKTGEGQEIETPMFEAMTSFAWIEHLAGETFDPPIGPPGSERHAKPMRFPLETADGLICILASSDKHWRAITTACGRPELADDPRYKDRRARVGHRQEVIDLTAEMARTRKTADLVDELANAGVPCIQINSLEEVVSDPHLADVDFFREFDHPSEGRIRLMAPPYTLSGTPAEIRTLPAGLGADSVEVLREAGFAAEEIARLVEDGVTVDAAPARAAAE